jgi:hypothetical protein
LGGREKEGKRGRARERERKRERERDMTLFFVDEVLVTTTRDVKLKI